MDNSSLHWEYEKCFQEILPETKQINDKDLGGDAVVGGPKRTVSLYQSRR